MLDVTVIETATTVKMRKHARSVDAEMMSFGVPMVRASPATTDATASTKTALTVKTSKIVGRRIRAIRINFRYSLFHL